jgi:uncharacterized LabA/DUF88 family protein
MQAACAGVRQQLVRARLPALLALRMRPCRTRVSVVGAQSWVARFNSDNAAAKVGSGNVALYLDLDNIMESHKDRTEETQTKDEDVLDVILEQSARYGKVIVRRAYGDAVRFKQLRRNISLCGIEMMDLAPHGPQQKNSGDIKVAVDALEAALAPGSVVDMFVIASGDSDFTPLLAKLRSYGKGTVMIARSNSMSNMLPAYCDHTLTLENLLAQRQQTLDADMSQLIKTLHIVQHDLTKPVPLARLEKQLASAPRKLQTALDVLLHRQTLELVNIKVMDGAQHLSLTRQGNEVAGRKSPFSALEQAAVIDSRLSWALALGFDALKHHFFLRELFGVLQQHGRLSGKEISEQLRPSNSPMQSDVRFHFSASSVERMLGLLVLAGVLTRQVGGWVGGCVCCCVFVAYALLVCVCVCACVPVSAICVE